MGLSLQKYVKDVHLILKRKFHIGLLGDSSKTIFNNPVKFTQALMYSPFDSGEINEIRTNKHSHTIVGELCRHNQNLIIEELLTVSQIGEWIVKCQVPLRDRFKFVMIYPVDLDTDHEKLKCDINVHNDIQLANIERLKMRKNGELLLSPTLKLAFN